MGVAPEQFAPAQRALEDTTSVLESARVFQADGFHSAEEPRLGVIPAEPRPGRDETVGSAIQSVIGRSRAAVGERPAVFAEKRDTADGNVCHDSHLSNFGRKMPLLGTEVMSKFNHLFGW